MALRFRTIAAVASTAMITLVLAGCTGTATPPPPSESPTTTTPPAVEYPAIEVGSCLGGVEQDAARGLLGPDFTAVIDCGLPHLFEVVGVIAMPEGWIDTNGTIEQIDEQRAALLKADGAKRLAFRSYLTGFCEYLTSVSIGIDQAMNGVAAGDTGLRPAGSFWIDATIASAAHLKATGATEVACVVDFTDLKGDRIRVTSPSGEPVIYDFLSPDFPVELRSCRAYAEPVSHLISCAEAHWIETFAEFDASIFGDEFVDRVWDTFEEGVARTQEDERRAADMCRSVFVGVADAGNPSTLTKISANFEWDWTKLNATHANAYPISCVFVATDTENYDVIGSRVGVATGDAELVRVN